MFLELAQSVVARPDIPNDSVYTLIIMILVPLFWILRAVAVVGIIYPILRLLFINLKTERITQKIIGAILWTLLNCMILLSSESSYWKWIWIDVIGSFIFIISLFTWNQKIIENHYKTIYIKVRNNFQNKK